MTDKARWEGDLFWGKETGKAHERRVREGFFEKYAVGSGIDIGAGSDPLQVPSIITWDLGDGDATFMAGVADRSYDFVYSSHCLEHLRWPKVALRHWWRILKPGGHLIVVVPHRDYYEKKLDLPSHWNAGHRWFWIPTGNPNEHTLGLRDVLSDVIPEGHIEYVRVCIDGFSITDPNRHSDGEFSIEAVVRKENDDGRE